MISWRYLIFVVDFRVIIFSYIISESTPVILCISKAIGKAVPSHRHRLPLHCRFEIRISLAPGEAPPNPLPMLLEPLPSRWLFRFGALMTVVFGSTVPCCIYYTTPTVRVYVLLLACLLAFYNHPPHRRSLIVSRWKISFIPLTMDGPYRAALKLHIAKNSYCSGENRWIRV